MITQKNQVCLTAKLSRLTWLQNSLMETRNIPKQWNNAGVRPTSYQVSLVN